MDYYLEMILKNLFTVKFKEHFYYDTLVDTEFNVIIILKAIGTII